MQPTRRGQIVHFHTLLEDEDPNDRYIVLEHIEDGDKSRTKIKELNSKFTFASINLVSPNHLIVDEKLTNELNDYIEHGDHNLFITC